MDGSSDSEVATISFLEPNEDSDRGDISQLQSNEEPLSSPESSFFKLQSCKRLSRRSSSYPRVHYRHESPSPPRRRCKPSRTRSSSVEHLKSLISAAITAVNRAGRSRVVSVQSCKYCVCVCVRVCVGYVCVSVGWCVGALVLGGVCVGVLVLGGVCGDVLVFGVVCVGVLVLGGECAGVLVLDGVCWCQVVCVYFYL